MSDISNVEELKIFAKNLNYYISLSGKQQKDIAKELGFRATTFNTWCMGKAMPKMGKLQAICDYFGILKSDLLEAKNTNTDSALSETERKLLHDFAMLDQDGKDVILHILELEINRCNVIASLNTKYKILQQNLNNIKHNKILPYYGKIAAAGSSFEFGDIIEENSIELPLTPINEFADYAIGISGDSMNPTFYDGDIVYVKKTDTIDVGEIGIFQINNCIYIKEVGDEELLSHNPSYKPILNNGDIRYLGKVIGKM